MDERDDLIREREQERARIERADEAAGVVEESTVEAPGDILGISRVKPGGLPLGERERDVRDREDGTTEGGSEGQNERSNVGTRDVTEGAPGGTGPDTGGSGVFRRRSGATGTDIGS